MYNREKSLKRDEPNPPLSSSFSSTLLDQIYTSIDLKSDRLKPNNRFPMKETLNLQRPCLVEKWMENKSVHDKSYTRRRQSLPDYYHDPMNFISSRSSSNSSSIGDMGSPAVYKPRTSCFTGEPRLMKIKTAISDQPEKSSKSQANPKEKISALKIYNNLKKMKQLPVSPGMRLTNFLNTLFRHGDSKKSGKQLNLERDSKQDSSTWCSASSYYRSCLTKKTTSTTSVNPRTDNGGKRTVKFKPQEEERIRRYMDDDDDDSDASSDLFELDHLAFMGSCERDYRDELPVMKLPTSIQNF